MQGLEIDPAKADYQPDLKNVERPGLYQQRKNAPIFRGQAQKLGGMTNSLSIEDDVVRYSSFGSDTDISGIQGN